MFCGYGFGGAGFGLGILGFIITLIFWVIIIWAIIAIVRSIAGHGRGGGYRHWHHMGMGDDAMRTLRDRYARGEITKEEYEQRKADLERY